MEDLNSFPGVGLEPMITLTMVVAYRDIHLRHGGWWKLVKIGWVLLVCK